MDIKKMLRKIRTNYRCLLYRGNKYECPFCGFKSRKLLPIGLPHGAIIANRIIGAGVREGGCVKCDSVDRDRLLYAYFKFVLKVFNDNKDFSILHLAPELMLSREFLKYKYRQYSCTDKFMPGYRYPDYTIDMDIMDISFQDNNFDLVICNHVLEHITDDLGAMKELYRVLKPGGTAVLQVPISTLLKITYENPDATTDKKREEYYGQYDHVRIYGQNYTSRLESVGFKVSRLNISEEFKKFGVIVSEDLFICNK